MHCSVIKIELWLVRLLLAATASAILIQAASVMLLFKAKLQKREEKKHVSKIVKYAAGAENIIPQ